MGPDHTLSYRIILCTCIFLPTDNVSQANSDNSFDFEELILKPVIIRTCIIMYFLYPLIDLFLFNYSYSRQCHNIPDLGRGLIILLRSP